MPTNEIDVKILKLAVNAVLDHILEDLKLSSVIVNAEEDLYWQCPAPEAYDSSKKPTDLTVGRLNDDMDFARLVHRGESADVSYNLVHLAPLLRYIGQTVKR